MSLAIPRRAVNLGSALDAPNEGEWDYRIADDDLRALADAGFDGVRLPIRWHAHTIERPPYTIQMRFFWRVDEIIEKALVQGLKVQIDLHHFSPYLNDPDGQEERYLSLWRQIAERYQNMPEGLSFELLNEPNTPAWSAARVTQSQRAGLDVIRATNPRRTVVLGGPNWNSIDGLLRWTPPDDPYAVATAHYYGPHDFTHQGAHWEKEPPRFDRAWGTDSDIARVRADIARAGSWAREHNMPLQIGEFGVIISAPQDQRALWLRTVREACEDEGAAWAVWDFAGMFAIYDLHTRTFAPGMLEALLG